MKCPKISIIVPVYNVSNYIRRCVESILGQTYENFELLLIDDGSTDSSGLICDELALISDKIKVCHQQNKGVSVARNEGVSIATGEYITFVDSDDFVAPEYLQHLFQGTLMGECGLVQAGYVADPVNSGKVVKCIDHATVTCDGDIIFTKIRGLVWSKLFLRDVIIDNSIMFRPGLTLAEDLCFVLDYLYFIENVAFIEATDYFYDIRENSASRKIHKVVNLYDEITVEYDLVNRLYDKWPGAHSGYEYRLKLLARSVFDLISNLYQFYSKKYIWHFISGLSSEYIDLLKHYTQPEPLKRLIARLAYKRKWATLYFIYNLKKFLTGKKSE